VLDTVTRADKLIEREQFTRTVEASLCFSRGGGRTVPHRRSAVIPSACACSGERRKRPRLTSPYTLAASTTLQGMKEYSRAQARARSTWSRVMIPCFSTRSTSDRMSVSSR